MSVTSPRVKQSVTAMRKPSVALNPTDQSIALGRVLPASLTSSAVIIVSTVSPLWRTRRFLTHMHSTVESDHRNDRAQEPDHGSCSAGVPTPTVRKNEPYIMSIGSWRKNPKCDDNREEPQYVENQQQAFHERKALGKQGVEDDGESGDGDDEQRAVPRLGYIGIRIIQDDQALNDGASKKGDGSDCSLPTSKAQPSDEITQDFLRALGSEFGNPIYRLSSTEEIGK
nr:hypothetical protein CFP56_20436 [Quercus suber]